MWARILKAPPDRSAWKLPPSKAARSRIPEPVSTAVGRGSAAVRAPALIDHLEVERALAECEHDLGGAGSVPGGVRERFLEDPVRGLVGGAGERPRPAVGPEPHGKPAASMAALGSLIDD